MSKPNDEPKGINPDLLRCDAEANQLIVDIGRRLRDLSPLLKYDALSLSMDLTVCHNVGHINLARLLHATAGDFIHDLGGIRAHLDRETGNLTDCFLPRCRS